MLRAAAVALALASAHGVCFDDPSFVDELGQPCSQYAALGSCKDEAVGLTALGLQRVLQFCQLSCRSCVKAADFCEIGLGGDQIEVPSVMQSFEFIDQPFLTTTCNWLDTPNGLRQDTNAWGNVSAFLLLVSSCPRSQRIDESAS